MPAIGGDIIEITVNHPTLGSKTFFPKANEGNTYDIGGIRSEDDADSVDGSGQLIIKKNRKGGFFEVVVSNDMNINKEAEFAGELAAAAAQGDWTFSVINGAIYGGTGVVVGDIQPNVNDATFTLKVMSARFKQI
tara:strand:+ start:3293 stop:3697 length:405 start_codon:yes stop_codon:yes gene_type:complete